ncbi:HD domain-containing protein [Candidatus Uhrbacteria bacterium]|nr:HD domain-containing protein [Candidatus Uhrbacteria bacterium]
MEDWKAQYRNFALQEKLLRQLFVDRFPGDESRLVAALELAKKAHKGQKRDEGDPYVIHPIRAARYLAEHLKERDHEVIMAMILHDVVEDTTVTLEQIRQRFGDRVAQLVDSVTRPRANDETEEEKLTSKPRNYQKVLSSGNETIRIKAADILDNMRSWENTKEQTRKSPKISRWLDEAHRYYFEIGCRAGGTVEQEMRQIAAMFN